MCSPGESHNPRWAVNHVSMLLSCLISKFGVSFCSEDRVLLCSSCYHPPNTTSFQLNTRLLPLFLHPLPRAAVGERGLELGCPMHSGLFSWPLGEGLPMHLDMTWPPDRQAGHPHCSQEAGVRMEPVVWGAKGEKKARTAVL